MPPTASNVPVREEEDSTVPDGKHPDRNGLEGLASGRTRTEGTGSMTTALAAVALVLGIARLAMFIALHLEAYSAGICVHFRETIL